MNTFDEAIRKFARPTEEVAFDNLAKAAQRQIDQTTTSGDLQNFEGMLSDLRSKCFMIFRRQDWYVVDRFKDCANAPHLYEDKNLFSDLIKRGEEALSKNDVDKLRTITAEMHLVQIGSPEVGDFVAQTNLLRG